MSFREGEPISAQRRKGYYCLDVTNGFAAWTVAYSSTEHRHTDSLHHPKIYPRENGRISVVHRKVKTCNRIKAQFTPSLENYVIGIIENSSTKLFGQCMGLRQISQRNTTNRMPKTAKILQAYQSLAHRARNENSASSYFSHTTLVCCRPVSAASNNSHVYFASELWSIKCSIRFRRHSFLHLKRAIPALGILPPNRLL